MNQTDQQSTAPLSFNGRTPCFERGDSAVRSGIIRLTPQTPYDVSADADQSAGAPEIEITPEMIEAGATLICEHFHDVVSRESGVVRLLATEVFRAMQTRRLAQTDKPPRAL